MTINLRDILLNIALYKRLLAMEVMDYGWGHYRAPPGTKKQLEKNEQARDIIVVQLIRQECAVMA